MAARGLLFDRGVYEHDYPFCWRAQERPADPVRAQVVVREDHRAQETASSS